MKWISSVVISAHFLFLLFSFFSKTPPPIKAQRIKVHTRSIASEPQPMHLKTPSAPKPSPPALKKPAPTLKKSVSSSNPSKSPPKPQKISQEILNQLEETIAQIEDKSAKLVSKTLQNSSAPHFSLQSEEESYEERILELLQRELCLPEEGKISVELTVSRNGHMEKCSFLKVTSTKNRTFLEKSLPSLLFPPFEKAFKNQKNHTFILHFESNL